MRRRTEWGRFQGLLCFSARTPGVAGHDEAYHLTYLEFAGGRIAVPREDLPQDHPVRLRVQARDVSLTLYRQQHTSIQNVFPARVVDLAAENPAQVMVRLEVGGQHLLARVTTRSVAVLRIEPGLELYAQVKGVALCS